MHAEDDGLRGQLSQDRKIELGLRRLDRDLADGGALELGRKGIAGGLVLHHLRIAEADMHRRRAA